MTGFLPIDPETIPAIQLGIQPYGVVWYLDNLPIVLGNELVWDIELMAVMIGTFGVLVHKRRWKTVVVYSVLMYLLTIEGQTHYITSISLGALSFVSPLFLPWSILDRLPIGWSLAFNDSHVKQAIGSASHFQERTHLTRYVVNTLFWIGPIIQRVRHKL